MLVRHNSILLWCRTQRESLSKMPFSSLSALWVIDISSREDEKLAGKVTSVTFWLVGNMFE